jgi:acyl dehydratase
MNKTLQPASMMYPVDRIGIRTIANTFEITPRLIQASAAAVQETSERYLDDAREDGLDVHPGLIFSLEWWTRFMPKQSLLPEEFSLRGVHAWTDIQFHRPFKEGDAITSQGQLVGISTIPPGTLTVTKWTFSDAWGNVVAEYYKGGIIRGIYPDGEDQYIDNWPQVPNISATTMSSAWSTKTMITANTAHIYSECAQIYNPIHTETRVAKQAGLPGTILHGVCTQTLAIKTILDYACDGDPKQLRRVYGMYRAMVRPETAITIQVIEKESLSDNLSIIYYEVLTDLAEKAIDNGAIVIKQK